MSEDIVELILDRVPNGNPNRVTSLALSSKQLFGVGIRKTRSKAKASALIDDARQLRTLRAEPLLPAESFAMRLAQFRRILDSAQDQVVPLRRSDLIDVYTALSKESKHLSHHLLEGAVLLLEALPGLEAKGSVGSGMDAAERALEIEEIEHAKCDIVENLINTYALTPILRRWRTKLFDAAYAIQDSFQSPSVISRVAAKMPLAQLHARGVENTVLEDFRKLLSFVEKHVDRLDGRTKAKAVEKLTGALLDHDKGLELVEDLVRLCEIAESIHDDDAKAEAVASLVPPTGRLGNRLAKDVLQTRIETLAFSIADPAAHARAAAAWQVEE